MPPDPILVGEHDLEPHEGASLERAGCSSCIEVHLGEVPEISVENAGVFECSADLQLSNPVVTSQCRALFIMLGAPAVGDEQRPGVPTEARAHLAPLAYWPQAALSLAAWTY